ncbi:MAG: hypothetical protein ACIAXF_07645 [Phycisphaerales bacterium JB063]
MQDETPAPQDETQALLDYVAEREVACPRCGYNLRGLTQPRCPECGNGLKLTVGSDSPINKAWLTMVVALIAPAGIGMFGCVAVGMSLQYFSPSDLVPRDAEQAFAMFSVGYAIACIPLSIAAIALRRWFSRLSAGTQGTCATIPVAIDVSCFVFFLSLLG